MSIVSSVGMFVNKDSTSKLSMDLSMIVFSLDTLFTKSKVSFRMYLLLSRSGESISTNHLANL